MEKPTGFKGGLGCGLAGTLVKAWRNNFSDRSPVVSGSATRGQVSDNRIYTLNRVPGQDNLSYDNNYIVFV